MLTQQHVALEKEIEKAFEHNWAGAGRMQGVKGDSILGDSFLLELKIQIFLFASCVFFSHL